MLDVMNILAVTANNTVNNQGVLLQGKLRKPLHLSSECPYRLKTFVEMIIHGSNGALILFFVEQVLSQARNQQPPHIS